MRKCRRVCALIFSAVLCALAVTDSASAEGSGRSAAILSRGALRYDEDKVVIDSSDLTYLADQIDELETAYKTTTVEALGEIHTFYSAEDGSITHVPDGGHIEGSTAADLSFEDLYQGIIQSQSVAHLSDTQAQDSHGSLLYYADDEAQDSHDLLNVSTDANEYPVRIVSAGPANLTAGTAAWVDGRLIVGSGADNSAYYDKAYGEAYEKGHDDAYDEAYKKGHDDAYDEAYAKGRGDAYDEAYAKGRSDAYGEAYEKGRSDTYDTAYNKGHEDAYNEAYSRAQAEYQPKVISGQCQGRYIQNTCIFEVQVPENLRFVCGTITNASVTCYEYLDDSRVRVWSESFQTVYNNGSVAFYMTAGGQPYGDVAAAPPTADYTIMYVP